MPGEINMSQPIIFVKKVYWNNELQGFKPVNRYGVQVLNLLGSGRSKFTVQNIRDLEALEFIVKPEEENLYD